MNNDPKVTHYSSFIFSTIIVLLVAILPQYTSWFVTVFFLGFALIYTFQKHKAISYISYFLFTVALVYTLVNI
ncbi:hypothetical protein C7B63_14745 [Bacillus halotolerans]|uniref:hypothetical protein n=1 Tax=Bacillus halotolerans TaxID=260554 RepID=UPI000D021978|nr:hypothetical protein [Bacillus halotolerans]MDP4525130.1 hypothetical protein [Bacillus halotolerans]PRP50261.1 hypothetical protein C7B63_14745 [Bacillus halotolerans]PRP58683.1 hypothetical protein C7B66_13275 [Bacillus halotolerans]PRP63622.1 hypothetical protein C7B72_12335 [Bacillus halotolerans]